MPWRPLREGQYHSINLIGILADGEFHSGEQLGERLG
jgi:biotin operon repressor